MQIQIIYWQKQLQYIWQCPIFNIAKYCLDNTIVYIA